MYTVIGATRTRTLRVMWLLEELGETYDQDPAAPNSDSALKYNVLGKIPALVDNGHTLTDSVAIMTYLADKHGRFTAPAGTPQRALQDAMTLWLPQGRGSGARGADARPLRRIHADPVEPVAVRVPDG